MQVVNQAVLLWLMMGFANKESRFFQERDSF